jgi:threonylcarbamoyladenosine tRNA methylthiotransferase MtaB
MPDVRVITFGCRLNAYESEVIRALARGGAAEETTVINTCAVTAEAERQARQAIRKARRERPRARIVVTGCAAQIHPEHYGAMAEVDQVLGNAEKLKAESYASSNRVSVSDIGTLRETAGHLIDGIEGRSRAFVQVQQGCDHRCTFCIIPFGRGPSRSVPVGRIAGEVRNLVARGVQEVVLTGVDITDYGKDLPGAPALGQMARRLLAAVPELPRLRLSSLDPVEIDEETFRLVAEEPRLMPHLHLSLQAGDDLVLKRMKRRHDRAGAVRITERLSRLRPGIALGADLIAGFPTETEAMFANTLSLVEDCGLAFLHVFPYSARAGTAAARMPQVAGSVRKARAERLRAAGDRARGRFLAGQIGRDASVLVEDGYRGHSEHFASVRLTTAVPVGTIARAAVVASDGAELLARAI